MPTKNHWKRNTFGGLDLIADYGLKIGEVSEKTRIPFYSNTTTRDVQWGYRWSVVGGVWGTEPKLKDAKQAVETAIEAGRRLAAQGGAK